MRNAFFLACALSCLQTAAANAESSDGTWNFTKGVDYENPSAPPATPQSAVLSLSGETLKISATCSVHLRKRTYYAGGPFQALLKSGQSEVNIARFLQKSLNFDLNGPKAYYETDDSECNKLGGDLLVGANQLVVIRGGDFFYAFAKQGGTTEAAPARPVAASDQSLKVSRLPFVMADYSSNCYPAMVKGVPQPSAKCAPDYYYHVASRNSTDPLSKLVGAHDYQKGGAGAAGDDYNNPVGHGLHPVFIVFPPMGDVTLVRVDDFEGHQERREQISGAFLVVKNGKVTDELNRGCDLDVTYVCKGSDGQKFKLMPTGKFEQIK